MLHYIDTSQVLKFTGLSRSTLDRAKQKKRLNILKKGDVVYTSWKTSEIGSKVMHRNATKGATLLYRVFQTESTLKLSSQIK